MDIARPMKKIEKLSGLCDGAKQRIVAAGALLVLVEPHRRALGVALGGLNRTIKIQCHPRQLFALKCLQHHATGQLPDLFNPIGIHLDKGAAGSGHIRKPAQAHQPQHNRVVSVIIHFAQPAKSQQQVHDQQQYHQMPAENGRQLQMRKASFQPLLQLQTVEELLKNQQPAEGCQLLVFEPQYRNFVEFCQNLCFTGFHLRWPPGCGRLFGKIIVLSHIPRASASIFYFYFATFYATTG